MPPADLINTITDLAEASTEQAGYGVIHYPDGTQHLPPDIEEIWMMVTGRGSSSSSEVSASSSSSSGFIPDSAPGSGASDPGSGAAAASSGSSSSGSSDSTPSNRYAWNQTVVNIDSNGIEVHVIDPSGLKGEVNSNPVIEVNQRTDVPEGYITRAYLSPSRNAWHFSYPGLPSTSSSPLKMVVDCAAGTIVVGQPPTTSSKVATTPSSGGTVPKTGDSGGGITPNPPPVDQ